MNTQFTEQERKELEDRNISIDVFKGYRNDLEKGYPFVELAGNAEIGREIKSFSDTQIEEYRELYKSANGLDVLKFVPASGAASRMFKDLYTALDSGSMNDATSAFFQNLVRFAFTNELFEKARMDKEQTLTDQDKERLLHVLLEREGLNYGKLPKGMIAFHKYTDDDIRTAFEEHFYEGALYAKTSKGIGRIHFTVPNDSQEELDKFLEQTANRLAGKLETDFVVETSIQKPSTDTPAIYSDNGDWVKKDEGHFLFRPAGHGALLENLNDLEADIIFVKNIDNVVPDRLKAETAKYKELLAGILVSVQRDLHDSLKAYANSKGDLARAREIAQDWFALKTQNLSDNEVFELLNRPIKVCGMVKNEGEPGGGPFLVIDKGQLSLQIVEKAQIDLENMQQKSILDTASHFNPVDLVLGVKDYNGNKFDLLQFRNPETGMRVSKTYEGRPIYALELPGLWNGAMYHWNTIFVEVPISTFNPVKTVLDLVRPAHLA